MNSTPLSGGMRHRTVRTRRRDIQTAGSQYLKLGSRYGGLFIIVLFDFNLPIRTPSAPRIASSKKWIVFWIDFWVWAPSSKLPFVWVECHRPVQYGSYNVFPALQDDQHFKYNPQLTRLAPFLRCARIGASNALTLQRYNSQTR